MVFGHPLQVEILSGDHSESLHAQGGPLVPGIRPDSRSPGMPPIQTTLRFLHVLRPGNRYAFGDRLAWLQPGSDFSGFHRMTELVTMRV